MTWIILGGITAFILLWGWYSSGLVMHLSRFPLHAIPATFGLPSETINFSSEDGVPLAGWFIEASPASDVTLIVCHGYGANRSDVLPSTHFLNKRGGYNLLYFDFRNHGESGGNVTSLGALEQRDLRAAIAYLKKEKPAQCARLGLFGLSMGGSVALSVAAKTPSVAAVAAESAFSSYDEVIARFARLFYHVPRYPFIPITLTFVKLRFGFTPDSFSPIHSIDRISPRPVFLIQGDSDARMPVSEGEALYARAKEPKALWTVPGADHAQVAEVAGAEFERRLLEFFAGVFK